MPSRRQSGIVFVVGLGMACALWAQAPRIFPNGVVNGASFRPATEPGGAVAPGSVVAIFGTAMANGSQIALTVPLSTTLLDTTVSFNGVPAPIFFVSETQVNAQIPFDVGVGTGTVEVRRAGVAAAAQVNIAPVSPGIFTLGQQGTGAGAIFHADDFRLVSATAPARRGEFLLILCTGLGRLVSSVVAGGLPLAAPPETVDRPAVFIGGISAPVSSAGIASGLVGLYQVTVQVPANSPVGLALPVQIVANGVSSNTFAIAIR